MRLSRGGSAQPHSLKTSHMWRLWQMHAPRHMSAQAEGCALRAGSLWGGAHLEDHAHVAAVRAAVFEGIQQPHAVRLVGGVAVAQLRQQRDLLDL